MSYWQASAIVHALLAIALGGWAAYVLAVMAILNLLGMILLPPHPRPDPPGHPGEARRPR